MFASGADGAVGPGRPGEDMQGRAGQASGRQRQQDGREDGGLASPKLAQRAAWVRRAWRAEARAASVGGSNSVVESQPSKLLVAGSIPVSRSNLRACAAGARFGWQALR